MGGPTLLLQDNTQLVMLELPADLTVGKGRGVDVYVGFTRSDGADDLRHIPGGNPLRRHRDHVRPRHSPR